MDRREFIKQALIASGVILLPSKRFWQLDQTMIGQQSGWQKLIEATGERTEFFLQLTDYNNEPLRLGEITDPYAFAAAMRNHQVKLRFVPQCSKKQNVKWNVWDW